MRFSLIFQPLKKVLADTNNNKYDIFISYRRDGGAQYARILQLML